MTASQVRFDASGSVDNDGKIIRYDWDFGDGQPIFTERKGNNPTKDVSTIAVILVLGGPKVLYGT